jgi:class 3 adenylate cyclase/predicted ATPase
MENTISQNNSYISCPYCFLPQLNNYAFCGHCGESLKLTCSNCAGKMPLSFRYCGDCGHECLSAEAKALAKKMTSKPQNALVQTKTPQILAQSAVARVTERRQVAVLFCDICGFTALSENLDPEDVSNIIQPLFQKCNLAINQFGGVVEKFIGDAIMALFGVPILHEDDPERAAMAALALRDIIQDYGKKLEIEHGFSVNMRIGLNVGTVVAGEVILAEGKNYQVMGDTINTAARMEQNALPGHILVTESMYNLLKDSFELKADKLIQAKGKKEPIQTFALLGKLRLQQRGRGMGKELAFVGRDKELTEITKQALKAINLSQSAHLLIQGVSGMGKTRLSLELYQQLMADFPQLLLIRSNGNSYSQDFSYFMLQNLLRSLLELDETISLELSMKRIQSFISEINFPNSERTANLISTILYPHHKQDSLQYIPPERLQPQLFKAVNDLLLYLSQRQPVFILIDDLQWCDPLSLEWLNQFMSRLEETPVHPQILCLTRRSGQSTPLESTLPFTYSNELQALSDNACQSMIMRILGIENIDMDAELLKVQESILKRAGGNPFYIEEVLKNLLDEGLLIPTPTGSWHLTCQLNELPMPGNIQRLIMARFDRLPSETRYHLQLLSALGSKASVGLLENIWPKDTRENLHDYLDDLETTNMVKTLAEPQGKVYEFVQTIVQEVIYNTMVKRRKYELHRQLGEALETHHSGNLEAVLDLLAYHFSRSNLLDKAIQFLYLASEQAVGLHNHTLVLQYYQQILNLIEKDSNLLIQVDLNQKEWLEATRIHQLIERKRCEVLLLMGEYEAVLENVELALNQELPLLEQARLFYCKAKVFEKRSEFQAAREVYHSAFQLIASTGFCKEQARLLSAEAWVCRWLNLFTDAQQACEQALLLLKKEPDLKELAYVHNVLGVVHYYLHEWPAAEEHYLKSRDFQLQINDRWGLANSLSNLGNLFFITNRWPESLAAFEESCRIRLEVGDLAGRATSCNNLGHVFQAMGDYSEAENYLKQALTIYQKLKQTVEIAVAICGLGTVAFRCKEWEKANQLLNQGIQTLEEHQLESILAEVYNHRIEMALLQSNNSLAINYFERDQAKIEKHGDPLQKGRLLHLNGKIQLSHNRYSESLALFNQALKLLQPLGQTSECEALYKDLAELHKQTESGEASYWQKMITERPQPERQQKE